MSRTTSLFYRPCHVNSCCCLDTEKWIVNKRILSALPIETQDQCQVLKRQVDLIGFKAVADQVGNLYVNSENFKKKYIIDLFTYQEKTLEVFFRIILKIVRVVKIYMLIFQTSLYFRPSKIF